LALGDELDAAHQDREPARLVDEVDRATRQCRFLEHLVCQPSQKDHGRHGAALAQLAQHFQAVHVRHPPIQQDHVHALGAQELERSATARAGHGLKALIAQVEAESAAKIVVVIDHCHAYRSGGPGCYAIIR
jgi:hypothetical protein